ncbi:MAG: FAD-dependent oxidoreductase [Bacillota bacterium]
MKVAIIGAGISGLSCAIELKKHGIIPTIFEKTKMLGDKPEYMVTALRIFHRSLRTPMVFFRNTYGITITPLFPLKELIMITPNKTISTRGNHGFVFQKGLMENSLEHQLASQSNVPIIFNADVKIDAIKNGFDHIVVATGSNTVSMDLNLWTSTFIAKCRIATVTGSFKPKTMMMYLNKNYGNNGYGYLLPKNEREAEMVLSVSDITFSELDYCWNEFIDSENLRYPIIKSHDIEHIIGYPVACQVGNIYFTGNCGGMIDDFLGFGMLRSIESGILAARAIVNDQDYNKLIAPFVKEVKELHGYREMLNILKNKDYDNYISIIGLPGLKHMVYNNPFYKAKYGILAPKIITKFKSSKYMRFPKR